MRAASVEPVDLPGLFSCLRERRLALVSAHRGQPDPTAAENALSAMTRTLEAGPILLEIDVRQTSDGNFVLMHDDTLDRTTVASGPVADRTLTALRRVQLKDPAGRIIDETVPNFADAMRLARERGAVLQVDIKRGVAFEPLVATIRAAGLAQQVVLIVYSLADAERLMALAPDMMLSVSGRTEAETARLIELASENRRLVGFTGTREPDPALIARMDAARMPAIVGTLGRAGQRLDDRYMADGDGREYADLAANGATLIASDRPLDAWAALKAAGRDGTACLEANGWG